MKRIITGITTIILILSISGCAQQGQAASVPASTAVANEETEVKEEPTSEIVENEPESEPAEEKTDEKEVDDSIWKDVLCDVLAEGKNKNDPAGPLCYYYLYDIDKDSIPELILQYGDCEANFRGLTYKYDIDKEEAVEVGDIGMGHALFYTCPDDNGIIEEIAAQGEQTIYKYTLENNSLKQEQLFYDYSEENAYNEDFEYKPVSDVVAGAEYIQEYETEDLSGILGEEANNSDTVSDGSTDTIKTADTTISSDMEKVLNAYEDYMHTNFDSTYGEVKISLLYINDDDVPEAIIEQDGDITWYIVTFDNGEVISMPGCEMSSLFYAPKGNGYYYDWSDGEESGSAYYIMNGSNVRACSEDELGKDFFNNCVYYEGKFYSLPMEAFSNIQ